MCEIVRKRHLVQAVIVNFAYLLANVSMACAAGPTLQETLDFIQKKLDGGCQYRIPVSGEEDGTVYHRREKDRKLTLLNRDTIVLEKNRRYLSRYTGPYRNLDGHLVSIKFLLSNLTTNVGMKPATKYPSQAAVISINCREEDCIEVRESSIDNPSKPAQKRFVASKALFSICPQDNQERIRKALIHAIRISGGKDELF